MQTWNGYSHTTYGSPTFSIDISGRGMHIIPETASTFTTTKFYCPSGPNGPTTSTTYIGYGSH